MDSTLSYNTDTYNDVQSCVCVYVYRLVVKLPSSGIHRLNYTVPLNATLLTEIKEKLENGQYYQNHVISIVGFQ